MREQITNKTISIRKRGNIEVKDIQTKDLVKEMKEHAGEELEHANLIAERVA